MFATNTNISVLASAILQRVQQRQAARDPSPPAQTVFLQPSAPPAEDNGSQDPQDADPAPLVLAVLPPAPSAPAAVPAVDQVQVVSVPANPPEDFSQPDPLHERVPQDHEDSNPSFDNDYDDAYGACGICRDGTCWNCLRWQDYYDREDRFDLADEI